MKSIRKPFHHLRDPGGDKPGWVYGQPEWEELFGTAEWSDRMGGLATGRLVESYCEPAVDLTIVLPSPRPGDFVWTWVSDCIVTERTLSLFSKARFTGFEVRPVVVERIKGQSRKRLKEAGIPPLWELLVRGKGGDAAPESGIHPLYEIGDSGTFSYSSFRNGIIVDEANWDGSDFFTVNGYPKYILVTERVKQLIIGQQLTNCALIPSDKLEWGSDKRPEVLLEETRVMAARDLECLLADLESADQSQLMDTIQALGEKGDPRAVDPLITMFDHPNPLIWTSAASSVAEIATGKDAPPQVREEVFSKLARLLGHQTSAVRECAATALGYISGERAAKEVMRVLEDEDESVRATGVFVIEVLGYKPALEAVRGLTRDRSKRVRRKARSAVRELESEFP